MRGALLPLRRPSLMNKSARPPTVVGRAAASNTARAARAAAFTTPNTPFEIEMRSSESDAAVLLTNTDDVAAWQRRRLHEAVLDRFYAARLVCLLLGVGSLLVECAHHADRVPETADRRLRI